MVNCVRCKFAYLHKLNRQWSLLEFKLTSKQAFGLDDLQNI